MTNYYGDEIVYDTIGNPIRIGMYDSDFDIWYAGYELEWNGRQLTSYRDFMEDDGIFYGSTYTYQYNADGIRTSKTVNGIEHKYYLNGSQILAETWKQGNVEHLLIFVYDENGSPIALKYRTNAYAENTFDFFFYEKNLQGDIIGIFNTNGRRVGWYIYDAWGVCSTYVASSTSSLEQSIVRSYNPYRYRGYYYDTETQLYYLQSRYYNPVWGRFLNPDGYINANGDILGYNMFAYCGNNPITRKDDGGEFWETVFDVVSLAFSVADVIKNPDDVGAWIGLAADAVDLIPFVTGVGEVTRAVRTVDNIADTVDNIVDTADNLLDTSKVAKTASITTERASAVRKAWKNEFNNVKSGGKGISRQWTDDEIVELLNTGKIKGYQGHHMRSVKGYPELAGDPNNIQFLTPLEHLLAHGGNFRNITHGRYVP